jgi:tetratricopeptide (TPR) repeat protein
VIQPNESQSCRFRPGARHGPAGCRHVAQKAISLDPNNADVKHSLGLLLVRQNDYPGALDLLRQAHELAPEIARHAYVYAVALNSTGAHASRDSFCGVSAGNMTRTASRRWAKYAHRPTELAVWAR